MYEIILNRISLKNHIQKLLFLSLVFIVNHIVKYEIKMSSKFDF